MAPFPALYKDIHDFVPRTVRLKIKWETAARRTSAARACRNGWRRHSTSRQNPQRNQPGCE